MDLIKKFMKIGGFKTREELEAYGEDKFFNDFPEARQYARGGTIEAYPQIATFDNAFSYGVPPGPQYLASGGSAYPMAQTEAQFFVPIYTDVANPYNMAYGGSNLEMYPNAKVPRVGPTNIWFQDGGSSNPMLEQVVQLLQQGIDPETVVEQLIKSGVPEQDAVQTVQAVVQEMQEAAQTQGQQQQMPPQQQPPMQESPMMQMGGQGENAEIGVGNRLGLFMNKVSNMAADYQNKKMNAIAKGYAKRGGSLMRADDGLSVVPPAAGGYRDVGSYTAANPLTAYQQQQFKNDANAYKSFLEGAYRSYYDIDPSQAVYSNDPVYQEMMKSYGIAMPAAPAATTDNTKTTDNKDPNKRITVDLNDLSALYTPEGRIKSRSNINGTRGRGRSDQYMWQTMFNTDNFAEAQRLAAETGLKIDEGTAGIFGRRKKYSYEWDPNRAAGPNTPNTPSTPGTTGTPGTFDNPPAAGTTTDNGPASPPQNAGFLERLFYQPGNRTSPISRNVNPRTSPTPNPYPNTLTSRFDPTGYDSRYSPMRNQIMQNRRTRIGNKLDALYQKEADSKFANVDLSNRDNRRMERLERRYNRIGDPSPEYSAYLEPKEYGGLPKAGWGLFNKTAGNENAPNRMSEQEASTFADDYLRGMDRFQENQNLKVVSTNFIDNPYIQQGLFGASDPMQRLYAGVEATYPERGIGRGNSAFTFNPINMDTQPYKNNPAYYDNFAAPSLAPSFSAKQGGSINQGDIRYMTDEEIAEFVANGGQVEYLD
jgi:hypothetical protein